MRARLSLPASASAARLPWLLLGVAALSAAGLLLYAGQADADHRAEETLHVCAHERSGKLRLGEDCRRREVAHVLATEDGLGAAEAGMSELESQVADLEDANADLEARIATLEGELAAATDRIATLEREVWPTFDSITAHTGDTGGNPDDDVRLNFSDPIDCGTVETGDFALEINAAPADVTGHSCSTDARSTFVIDTDSDISPGETVTVTIINSSALKDEAGNGLTGTLQRSDDA